MHISYMKTIKLTPFINFSKFLALMKNNLKLQGAGRFAKMHDQGYQVHVNKICQTTCKKMPKKLKQAKC